MKLLRFRVSRVPVALLGLHCLISSLNAADPERPSISAKDLADRLSAFQDGASYVRLRLVVNKPSAPVNITLQLQIKERRANHAADVLYQVLWPKERKGEAVLLHKSAGGAPSGLLSIPPNKPSALNASQMNGALFGSDLSYEDVLENFFAWDNQAIIGNEVLNRVSCLVLESKPGKGQVSIYSSVRAWIDPGRLVPLRVEKYSPAGQLARRIETTRVVADDKGRPIPADLNVRGPREDSVTELDGSRIKHDVVYADRVFTSDGLGDISAPASAPE
jgi:hypothetical protein